MMSNLTIRGDDAQKEDNHVKMGAEIGVMHQEARRSNQSILKEIKPEYSLEGLMLKLQFQYTGHVMQKAGSLEKTWMLEKIEGRRRRGRQR